MSTTPRLVRVSLYVLVAAVAIQVADPFLGLAKGELLTRVIEDWLYNGVLIGAALVCVARAVRVREERLAWSLIGFGMVAWSAADLYYTLVLSKLDAPPYPSISDAGWLVFYPACWAAVVLLMRRRIREFHASLWLDGIVAALGVAALTAALVLPPILAMSVEGEPSAVAVEPRLSGRRRPAAGADGRRARAHRLAARPAAGARGRGARAQRRRRHRATSARSPHGQADSPAWLSWLWPASAVATALGAWQPLDRARAVRLEGRRLLVLPFGAMAGRARPAAGRPLPSRERHRRAARLRHAGRRRRAALAHARRAHEPARHEPRRGAHRRADRPRQPAPPRPRTSRAGCAAPPRSGRCC